MTLSVVIITYNEEENIGRTLESVASLVREVGGEIIVVDSGSTDRTREIAEGFGAKVFVEEWKGFAAQKNSAIEEASGDWILSLDADEEVSLELVDELGVPALGKSEIPKGFCATFTWNSGKPEVAGFLLKRRNLFLGRWIKHGGFWPDRKLRLFRRGCGRVEERAVHENVQLQGDGNIGKLNGALIHHAYPTLSSYIEHMNRYSSLGAEMAVLSGRRGFSVFNIVLRPLATFIYNYIFRLGFLDGREGLLLHLYHAAYVSWKYAKAWELSKNRAIRSSGH